MLKQRILDALNATTNPYLLATPPQYDQNNALEKSRWPVREQTKEYVLALVKGKEYAELPEQLKPLSGKGLIEITAPVLSGKGGVTPDPESALGLAFFKAGKDELPVPIGVYDLAGKKQVAGINISAGDIQGPGYHLYRGPRFTLSDYTYIYFTKSWQLQAQLPTLYNPASPQQQWDVYVSMKLTGDGVYIDRIFLAPVAR